MAKKPDEIAASMLARILDGELTEFPRESDVADEYDVAKGTAREARRVLQDGGVLEVKHGRPGARILPAGDWNLFDAPLLEVLLDSPARAMVLAEIAEYRRLFEPEVAARAAVHASPECIAALDAALDQLRAASRLPAREYQARTARRNAEHAFRRAVLDAAGNRFITRALTPLAVADELARVGVRRSLKQHKAIRDAVAAGDGERAREAMHARLDALLR